MYRIRFHGRGGQGMKTGSRILGTAFFLSGFEVQDAPRYGAERRGAPIFAYVRASKSVIQERGIIRRPDLVLVADETLVAISAAGVLSGVAENTVLLISSGEKPELWRERLNFPGLVLTLPAATGVADLLEIKLIGAACAGAAGRLVGVIPKDALAQAIQDELAPLGEAVLARNLEHALTAYDKLADHTGCVREGKDTPAEEYEKPPWVDLPFDEAGTSAPDIFTPATSAQVPTGLWRTVRPVIDYAHCHRCAWICSTLCPDSTISVNAEGYPQIDYEHCKGCLICMANCPSHAIRAVPEHEAAAVTVAGGRS
ncbi:MAG: 2-oxoacid:acceptor oxidoreductase family protein [Syntrophobacterales bacterium]|jgi:pyruvate ferredoxin oxidoreductase gamma subunit|nr:2-oxoacid:acceptor oxidoreductase family protein [Syntrophobacterales bacterium]